MDTNDDTNIQEPNNEPPVDLVQAAERGDPEAAYQLGKFYSESKPRDPEKAFHWMQRAVELGSPGALNGLGVCYLHGFGVEQNIGKAVQLFRQGVEKDVPNAFYNLGQCYYHGWGVKRNLKKSMRLTRLAADKGTLTADKGTKIAVNFLTSVYLHSGSKRNKKIAFQYLRKTAETTLDPELLHRLAYCYLNGVGTKQNDAEAVRLLRLTGSPTIEFLLGWCYLNGRGVKKNLKESTRLFRSAADKGSDIAADYLSSVYLDSGSKRDKKFAFQHLRKTAETTLDPEQLYSLAYCYLYGVGTKRNDAEAVRVLRLAGSPMMQYLLGWCYLHGRGVEKNLEQANHHFQAAAETGCPEAQYEWGCSLQTGRGTAKNREEGRKWLIRAAEKDYPWDEEAEKRWRLSLLVMCCAFLFWTLIPVLGVASLIEVLNRLQENEFTQKLAARAVSSFFLLAGPITFWFGIFCSLRIARWGCVLMVLSGIELASEMCWCGPFPPEVSYLLLFAVLIWATWMVCRNTARRTYCLELKRNKREISFVRPVLICSGFYLLSLLVRHYMYY